jgi:2,3-bisphosphoglycerate-independent phosphoglycerate mutase
MNRLQQLQGLAQPADSKILLYVIDGVGGVPHPKTGQTELQTANIPNIDRLASASATGRILPAGVGVAPGSGPAQMALFGYPTDDLDLPRGVLEVLGASTVYYAGERAEAADFEWEFGDLTARGNFGVVDPDGLVVTSRRARLTDDENEELVKHLSGEVHVEGVEIFFFPGKGHRFAVLFRAPGLEGPLNDSDPLTEGQPIQVPVVDRPELTRAAEVVSAFLSGVHRVLGAEGVPNFGLLRGIGGLPRVPTFQELYDIRPLALAVYPMYRGAARLVGMDVIPVTSRDEQLSQLEAHYQDYDFFFVHIKETDTLGHRGDFSGRVSLLETIDTHFQACVDLGFDVVILTGDHSTPAVVGEHTHHPVPTLVWSEKGLVDPVKAYSEIDVLGGSLGTMAARDLLAYGLAEAGRLRRFGG